MANRGLESGTRFRPHIASVPPSQLDIDDYLSASADASARTRSIITVMVVLIILVLAGLFNSLQSQWMKKRMIAVGNQTNHDYLDSKLDRAPTGDKDAIEFYHKRREALAAALETAYVEGSLVVKVPFFGITFDVNDLGVIGGLAFLIVLSCYRFFLSREIDNLRISFTVARYAGADQLANFYSLLAMRQVFTIPESGFINRTPFLKYVPKLINWIPALLLILVATHDYVTRWIGDDLAKRRFWFEWACQLLCIVLTAILSRSLTIRLFWMDEIWNATGAVVVSGTDAEKADADERWRKAFRYMDVRDLDSPPRKLPAEAGAS